MMTGSSCRTFTITFSGSTWKRALVAMGGGSIWHSTSVAYAGVAPPQIEAMTLPFSVLKTKCSLVIYLVIFQS
ncbi:hypothetical protein BDV12DRAFT_178388 [Aspergillus spectabilis]